MDYLLDSNIILTYSRSDKTTPVKFSSRNMGKNDLWIAATASAFDLQLVTNRPARFAYDVEGEDLLPGGTLEVRLNNFWIHTGGAAGDIEPVCFWISHPDDKTDANSGNDGTCADFVVSMPDIPKAMEFKFFPNPAQDELFIDWSDSGTVGAATCRIIHPTGQILEQFALPVKGNNPLQVNISPYPPGVYILSFQTADGESFARRFVIAR